MLGVAPYTRIVTAADLRFLDRSWVTSADAYLGWYRERLADAGDLVRPWTCDLDVFARVNHGRWIADCPNCHGGASTHPDWKLACCSECGCVMRHVVFPDAYQSIERALLCRSVRHTQNWVAPETLDDLLQENTHHGVS